MRVCPYFPSTMPTNLGSCIASSQSKLSSPTSSDEGFPGEDRDRGGLTDEGREGVRVDFRLDAERELLVGTAGVGKGAWRRGDDRMAWFMRGGLKGS